MSIFAQPTPFAEAMESHTVRALMPTNLSSADLEKLGQDVLRRSMFAARLDNAADVQWLKDRAGDLIDGKTDFATVRQEWQDRLDARGYVAPSEDEEGSITDLRSERRTNLILQMNVQMAQGYGRFVQGQDQAILDHWPAQELYRQEPRKEHRDWPTTWRENGGAGKMYGSNPDYPGAGRMIALKDDPIWVAISRFGNPYPPFDYNSGMGLRDITRKEAVSLGLMDPGTQIKPVRLSFNHNLKAGAIDLDDDIRGELESEGYKSDGGSLSLGPTGEHQG